MLKRCLIALSVLIAAMAFGWWRERKELEEQREIARCLEALEEIER